MRALPIAALLAIVVLPGCAPDTLAPAAQAPVEPSTSASPLPSSPSPLGSESSTPDERPTPMPPVSPTDSPSPMATTKAPEPSATPTVVTSSPSAASASPTAAVTSISIPAPSSNEVARLTFGSGIDFQGFGAVRAGEYTVEVGCQGSHTLGYQISLDGTVVSEGEVKCAGGTVSSAVAFGANGGEEVEIAQVGDYPSTTPGYIRVLLND